MSITFLHPQRVRVTLGLQKESIKDGTSSPISYAEARTHVLLELLLVRRDLKGARDVHQVGGGEIHFVCDETGAGKVVHLPTKHVLTMSAYVINCVTHKCKTHIDDAFYNGDSS